VEAARFSLVIDLVENRIRGFPSSRSAEPLELKIVPWSELKPHIDVFEADGKARTGLFVANNPINEIDPFGLQGLNLAPTNSATAFPGGQRLVQQTNVFNLVAHGSPRAIFGPGGNRITPSQAANMITNSPGFRPGIQINVIACETGRGPNSFAEQLSNLIPGSNVRAPTTGIEIEFTGAIFGPQGTFTNFFNSGP